MGNTNPNINQTNASYHLRQMLHKKLFSVLEDRQNTTFRIKKKKFEVFSRRNWKHLLRHITAS